MNNVILLINNYQENSFIRDSKIAELPIVLEAKAELHGKSNTDRRSRFEKSSSLMESVESRFSSAEFPLVLVFPHRMFHVENVV